MDCLFQDRDSQHIESIAGYVMENNIRDLHRRIWESDNLQYIDRMSIAVYDHNTDYLRTFLYSGKIKSPLNNYSAKLSNVPSLVYLAKEKSARVINDLSVIQTHTIHNDKLQSIYQSSYTFPIYYGEELFGFAFLNSTQKNYFTPQRLELLRPYMQMLILISMRGFDKISYIFATIKATKNIGHLKDEETGGHIIRMQQYVRILAQELAKTHEELNDERIEYIYQYASLHDVGKFTIPDSILQKNGRLTEVEYAIMKSHVLSGVLIINQILESFNLRDPNNADHDSFFIDVLQNIVYQHHEFMDGSGYPQGLKGDAISLEARIITVADIFDALVSKRYYKEPWSIEKTLRFFQDNKGVKFYPPLVDILIDNIDKFLAVKAQFGEDVQEIERA